MSAFLSMNVLLLCNGNAGIDLLAIGIISCTEFVDFESSLAGVGKVWDFTRENAGIGGNGRNIGGGSGMPFASNLSFIAGAVLTFFCLGAFAGGFGHLCGIWGTSEIFMGGGKSFGKYEMSYSGNSGIFSFWIYDDFTFGC